MACILVALGLMPFAGASASAVSSARLRIAEETGKQAVAACSKEAKLDPQTLLTRESFLNAITVLQAIGGSTNAVVHLMAIIGRHPLVAGTITLHTVDAIGRKTPLLVDLKPSGENYMTDFHNSGKKILGFITTSRRVDTDLLQAVCSLYCTNLSLSSTSTHAHTPERVWERSWLSTRRCLFPEI